MKTRITVPEEHCAIVLPIQLYEELIALLGLIYRNKRLQITPGIRGIAGDVVLATIATVPVQDLLDRLERDRFSERLSRAEKK